MYRARAFAFLVGVTLVGCLISPNDYPVGDLEGHGGGLNNSAGGVSTGGTQVAGNSAGGTTATGGSTAAGGSVSSGGAANGSGGAASTTVLDCDSLAAAGTWEEITPPNVDTDCHPNSGGSCTNHGSMALALDPHQAGVIYLGTSNQGVWKSTDCGQNWTMVSTGSNSANIGSAELSQLEIDPVDPSTLYTHGTYTEFKSTNGGIDWTVIWPMDPAPPDTPSDPRTLAIDPEDHEHLLMSFGRECPGASPGCIAESKNGGSSWTVIDTPATGNRGFVWFFGTDNWLLAQEGHMFRTSNAGADWHEVASGFVDVQGHLYRASDGAYYLGAKEGVLKSATGESWSLVPDSGQMVNGGVVGNGSSLYASYFGVCFTWNPNLDAYASAPEVGGEPWTNMESPGVSQGGMSLGYDTEHHVLYSSNCNEGLWRQVTD